MARKRKNIHSNQADGQRDSVVGGAAAPTTYPMHAGNGASPSNTAPANCTGSLSGTTILRTGIDSIPRSGDGSLLSPGHWVVDAVSDNQRACAGCITNRCLASKT